MDTNNKKHRDEVYSKRVKAGKRTYFFDVKQTRSEDHYITITESKRKHKGDDVYYEKHKLFLYKEDFDKFEDALNETIGHIKSELETEFFSSDGEETSSENWDSSVSLDGASEDDDLKWDE